MSELENSIVIDTCVMRLYDTPADPIYKELFLWLNNHGELYVSKKLVQEYLGTGNRHLSILFSELTRNADLKSKKHPKLTLIKKNVIDGFKKDKSFTYTCNIEDVFHAKLVFISPRKKIVSQDKKLIHDINKFNKVDGIKPCAEAKPQPDFYAAQ